MILRCGVAAVSAFVLCTSAAAQDAAMTHLECLGSSLRSEEVWTASYEQVFTPAGMTMGEEATGTVWLGWPDKARFHTGEPTVRLMGLLGRTIRLVDLEVPSCDDHLLSDEEWERIPLAAVLDPGGAVEIFTVLGVADRRFALEPRETGGVERVEVEIDGACLPAEVMIVDPQGAINRLRFRGWKGSSTPAGGEWLPRAPKGLECRADIE